MTSSPTSLTCEYLCNPLGLDVRQPRLSWKVSAAQRGARQTAYQIVVAEAPAILEAAPAGQIEDGLSWDTGKVVSDTSVHVPYAGAALQPSRRFYWRVRIWDEKDAVSEWSEMAFWETGLLRRGRRELAGGLDHAGLG